MNKYDRFLTRGKPIDGSKDYVYGTLNIIEVCTSPIKVGQEDTDCNLYKITYRVPNTVADWNLPYPQKSTFVKPETVGRYTGQDDALGNKIFEGDIVSFDDVKDIRKEILRQRAEQFGKRVQNIDADDEDEEYDED